jgi:hypothetical protein
MNHFSYSSSVPRRVILAIALSFGTAPIALADDLLVADQPEERQARLVAEVPYWVENNAAMTKMMNDMGVQPTGDVDKDFVDMMVPHHQGAIDMAIAVLRYGNNEQLKRLAQEIIVTQQQEIAAMRLAVGEPLPPSIPSPTQPATENPSMPQGAMTMSPAMKMK